MEVSVVEKNIKESWCGKHPCLPPATSSQPSPSPCAAASISKTARENTWLKLAFPPCPHQIGFNPQLTPDLIDTAVISVNVMENVISRGSKMTWILLLVAAPAFSGFSCMWRSALKILSVPGHTWRCLPSGKWGRAHFRQLCSVPDAGDGSSGWEEDMEENGLIFLPAVWSKSIPNHSSWSWLVSSSLQSHFY